MRSEWAVRFSKAAEKSYKKLKICGVRPSVNDIIDLLVMELTSYGPERIDWPNFGKLSSTKYHCHLKKGKPTYVACWSVIDYNLGYIPKQLQDSGIWQEGSLNLSQACRCRNSTSLVTCAMQAGSKSAAADDAKFPNLEVVWVYRDLLCWDTRRSSILKSQGILM